jgi:hypothetical protein
MKRQRGRRAQLAIAAARSARARQRLGSLVLLAICAIAFSNNALAGARVGLAKAASAAEYLGEQTFTSRVTLVVENLGDVPLTRLTIQDDLAVTFADAESFDVLPGSLSSDQLRINPGFNGRDDVELLAEHVRLDIGEQARVAFDVRFRVRERWGVFYNTAHAVSRECVPDDSTNGLEPDPDGNGIPDEDEPTPIPYDVPGSPSPGVAKAASPTEHLGDRTFRNLITVTVENFGDEPLRQLTLTDNLQAVFGTDVEAFEVEAGSLVSGDLTINPGFNGDSDQALLAGQDALAPGGTASVSFAVRYQPVADEGVFENQVSAGCALCLADLSTDGSDPDPDGDGDPREQSPTPLPYALPETSGPRLGLAKEASVATAVEGNLRETELTIRVRNFGDQTATAVQLSDPLAETFAAALPFEVVAGSLSSPTLAINPGFDGERDDRLLAPGQTLAPGATALVRFRARFTVTEETGAVFNSAFARDGSGPQDQSTNGSDPDPNGDGVPDEREPTPIEYELTTTTGTPVPGLAKALQSLQALDDDRYELTFLLTAENFGTAAARGLQISDSLADAFPAPATFSIQSLSSSALTVNPAYNGRDDRELLQGVDTLEAGASATLTLVVILQSAPARAYENQAELTTSDTERDQSTDGPDPDPDGNGVPDENEVTRIVVPERSAPALTQLLRIDVTPRPRVTRIGRVVGYTLEVANLLDQPQTRVTVADTAPLGFSPDAETVVLVRAGPDGVLETADDLRSPLAASGTTTLTFAPFDLAPQEAVQIRFASRVTSAARLGPAPNKSVAASDISSEISDNAVVDIIADTLFETATVIGKVFHDRDGNGKQNPNGSEEGVAGARLITPEGLRITTDQHGRYHIADIAAPDRFGVQYVIKLDASSIPLDGLSVSDPRQIVRLSPGGLAKANFAVRWKDREGEGPCCGEFEHLDTLGPWPGKKKLDVALRNIARDSETGAWQLGFDVRSNYFDVASCLQVAVFEGQSDTPVAEARKSLRRTTDHLIVDLAHGLTGQRYRYALYATLAAANPKAGSERCPDLFTGSGEPLRRADQTQARLFELPAGELTLPAVDLDSSLVADRLALPANLPLRTARRRDGRYQAREQLATSTARLLSELAHDWQAREDVHEVEVKLAPGKTVEVAGFESPAQLGGAVGAIRVERDNDDFADGMAFRAEGMQAELTCCDLPSRIETVLDPDNAVYSVRYTNLHQTPLQICLQPVPANLNARAAEDIKTLARQCWAQSPRAIRTVRPGNSIEFFEGQFLASAPEGGQPWRELLLLVREPPGPQVAALEDPRNGFRVVRDNLSGELWTLPRTFGLCGDVSSEIDITNRIGVAAQKLRGGGEAPPLIDESLVQDASLLGSNQYVAVLDLSLGGYQASGALESFARRVGLDNDLVAAGRIAGYWRGSRYLGEQQRQLRWTLQMDSTKDELSRLGDNLTREDPRRLFRTLDSDRYYPTYGDDSTTILETDSQGAFFGRIELDDSYAGWGNFNANFTDTELAHFNRTLYGLNAQYRSDARTGFGDHRMALKVFGSEAQTVSAHESFLATGGSLYYLQQTDIVLGSEQLRIEVRRRGSQQLEERRVLVAGTDYELDPLQGRILLSQPLLQSVRERRNPVVFSEAQEGDQVYLAVDYEYLPAAFGADEYVYGVRGSAWVTDRLRIGGTHVRDEQGAGDYQLSGADLHLRHTDRTWLSAEYADSRSEPAVAPLVSLDGGLSFRGTANAATQRGRGAGYTVEGQIELSDFNWASGHLRGWYSDRDAGYGNSRFAANGQVRDQGADLALPLGNLGELQAGYRRLEQGSGRDEQSAWLQLSRQWQCEIGSDCWTFDVEGRYDSVARGTSPGQDLLTTLLTTAREGTGTAVGVRLGHRLSESTTVYGSVQQSFASDTEYADNDRIALGANQRLNDRLGVSLEASDGGRGSALSAGVDYSPGPNSLFNLATGIGAGATTQFSTRYQLSDQHAVYGSYRVNPDRTDAPRNILSIGQRRDLGARSRIYSESQFGELDREASTGHLFGVDLGLSDTLVLAGTAMASRVERPEGDFERNAFSLGMVYSTDNLRLSTRAELRADDGVGRRSRQYLLSNALDLRVRDSGRLIARFNAALLDDERTDADLGRFAELNLGYAYRPVNQDYLNGMLRYAYLYDVGTEGQSDVLGDEQSHLLSAEGFVEATPRVQLGAKVAGRHGRNRAVQGSGRWEDVRLSLASARVLINLTRPRRKIEATDEDADRKPLPWLPNQLELLGEYRWLRDWEGETTRHGLVLGLYYQIDSRNWNSPLSNSLRVGAGYNFSGFDDNLRRDSFNANGWFIDITSAF